MWSGQPFGQIRISRVASTAVGSEREETRRRGCQHCTNQQPSQRGGAVPDPILGWFEMAVGLPEGPSYPGNPLHFFAMLPPERPQKGCA